MFKFNNNHIFTGYLKQLLASFHLPKCRVYTKELEEQECAYQNLKAVLLPKIATLQTQQATLETNLQEVSLRINSANTDIETRASLREVKATYLQEYSEITAELTRLQSYIPKILPTTYHSAYYEYPDNIPDDQQLRLTYPTTMRYIPYIKDGYLQVYTDDTWHNCHINFDKTLKHDSFHKTTKTQYPLVPYAYGQKILNYTKNLQIQNTVYDSYTHEYLGDYLRFHRDFMNLNLMPLYNCFSNRACPHLDLSFTIGNNYAVKFKTDQSFDAALYKYYMVPVKFFKDYTIAIDSEASIEVCCCVYDEYKNKDKDFSDIPKLTYHCFSDLQFKKPVLYTGLQKLNSLLLDSNNTTNDLCQQEDNLKLILKIPTNNKSSIVILEGDYTTYNDVVAKPAYIEENGKQVPSRVLRETNHTVINYEYLEACDFLSNKLITPLQLLRTNTGESYPFADRLVEYLVGNAITVNEEIQDNVVRAKKVISSNCNPSIYPVVAEDGVWEPILQCLTYDYINEKRNTHDINHDILGFIDKDVERWYATESAGSFETIANVDIYKD